MNNGLRIKNYKRRKIGIRRFYSLFIIRNSGFGFSLVDTVIAIGIIVLLFGGIYLVYFSVLDVVRNFEFREAAASVLDRQVEIIRNLAYEKIGTAGGVPAGIIPPEQTVAFGDLKFLVKTTVRNIDDPFDGVLGGSPNDTAPADYKLVELEVSCPACQKFVPLIFTTTVAPKNLESASSQGSLFISAFDASGIGVGGASVHVVNASVTPTIDLLDATNLSGVLQLVGVPTSTQSYQIKVTKTGYSSEKTYPAGGAENPNPVKPHATVAAQSVTSISFAIDRVSVVNVYSSGVRCEVAPDIGFSMTGTKLIGTNPDILKFSTSSNTGGSGLKTINSIEWDTYSLLMNEPNYDLVGTIPFSRVTINPSSTTDFRMVVRPAFPKSLLVTVKDAVTSEGVMEAAVNLSKTGFSNTAIAGHSFFSQTDWSGGQYNSQDGGINTGSPAGTLKLLANASSTYNTSTVSWLVSNAFDLGGASSTFYALRWNPESQTPQTGVNSLKFQLSTNNDNATWNFAGPDGTTGTFYTVSNSTIWSGHNNNRYLSYKVFLSTADENFTPQLEDVSIEFKSRCVPPYQALFNNLSTGDYSITVDAAGHLRATSSVAISADWHQAEILMTPQ